MQELQFSKMPLMACEQSTLPIAAKPQVVCKNCGIELSGRFCSRCGQRDKPLDPSLHDLVHELVHEFLHFDGKIVTTLKALVLKPGRLSADFLAGRYARYIGPVRFYLVLSVLFFLTAAYSSQHASIVHQSTGKRDAFAIDLKLMKGNAGSKEEAHTRELISKAVNDPELFRHAFLSNISRVMFVIVPLFALGLRIAYRNHNRRYPSFVYFSLHYHSFVFLALTVFWLAGLTRVALLQSVVGWAVLVWIPVYLFVALREVFGGSRIVTVLKMAALGAFYLPCFAVGMAVAAIVTLYRL